MTPNDLIAKRLRQARRRLFLQGLLDRAVLCCAVALGVALLFLLAAPFLPNAVRTLPRGGVLLGLTGVGLAAALAWSIRRAPLPSDAALAIDRRFHLQERVTTALSLSPADAATPAGEALLADAAAKLDALSVRSKFPVAPGRRALVLPAQAVLLAAAILFYQPAIGRLQARNDVAKKKGANADDAATADAGKGKAPRPIEMPPDRADKSEELRNLEEELKKLYADASKPADPAKQEQIAKKLEEVATAEERLRKYEARQAEKFQRIQEQLQKLGQLDAGANKQGPAKDFNDALSKGDIAKAKEEADRLAKKAKERKLDPKEADQLKEQLQDLQEKVERLSRYQEEQQKLKDLIDKAKKEGRDAETLERELKQLQEELKQLDALKQLAEKLGDVKQSLDMNDLDGVEKNLGDLAKQLQQLGDTLGDLDDVEEHLQNLKEMRQRLAGGKKGGDGDGRTENDTEGGGRGQASGKRPENPDARTDSEDARQRGRFDRRGRKTYAGAVPGPAFTRKTTLELEGEIKQAAQEAPNAVEVQRLPRAAREMIKEYFENLGGQGPRK